MEGQRVQVYFNLHKKCFSVRCKKTRLVIAHVNNIYLEDVVFKVSENGRQRVLKEQRKNVHAIIEGTIYKPYIDDVHYGNAITYNPYKYKNFVNRYDESEASASKLALYVNNKIPSIWECL